MLKKRHNKSYREYLEPMFEQHNLKFISSQFPGWFQVGPFQKIEAEVGRPQSKIPFIGSGEYCQYRIVEIQTCSGKHYTLWALLDFELFSLQKIRWRVSPGDPISEEFEKLLEQ